MSIRCICIVVVIIIFFYSSFVLAVQHPSEGNNDRIKFMWFVVLVGAVVMLFGAILEDVRLVLVASLTYLVGVIYMVIVILGIYFNFGGFRDMSRYKSSVNEMVMDFVHSLVAQILSTFVAFVYYYELHGSGDDE